MYVGYRGGGGDEGHVYLCSYAGLRFVWSGDFLSKIMGLFSSPIRRPVALGSGLVQSGAFPAGRTLQDSDPP